MINKQDSERQLITAFELMWGKYTEPVMLIDHKFNIIAINEAYKATGGVAGVVGGKCNVLNPELHNGCKAMVALNTQVTQVKTIEMEGIKHTTLWIPITGFPDYFIHLANGANEYFEKLKTK